MPEKPDRLREEAVKHFNRTIDLMQEGKPEESLEALQKAENAAQEAKSDAILFHTLKARGQILQSLGRLEEALDTYVFSLKISYKLLSEDPGNELYKDTIRLNLNNIGNSATFFRELATLSYRNNAMRPDLRSARSFLIPTGKHLLSNVYGKYPKQPRRTLFSKGQLEEAEENTKKPWKYMKSSFKNTLKIRNISQIKK